MGSDIDLGHGSRTDGVRVQNLYSSSVKIVSRHRRDTRIDKSLYGLSWPVVTADIEIRTRVTVCLQLCKCKFWYD